MPALSSAVRELYTNDPAQFVSRRTALAAHARQAGDKPLAKAISQLRKPTAAAAAVNRLDDDSLDAVLNLGRELRAAQTRLDAEAMKELTTRRQRVLHDAVTRTGLRGAGAEEVRATLLAATADAAAADAVASRALVTALRYSGWGDVDLGDAVAHQVAAAGGRPALRVVEAEQTSTPEAVSGPGAAIDPAAATDASGRGAKPITSRLTPSKAATPPPAETSGEAPHLIQRRRQEAQQEVTRLTARLRAAQAAVDAATAARDSAQLALDAARQRLAEF